MRIHPLTLEFGWSGDGGLGERLIADILAGRKSATCCPLASCTAEEIDAARVRRGRVVTVVDRIGAPHCNVRVLDVVETPWGDPDARIVRGEGFESADAWRAAMSNAWRDLIAAGAFELRDDTPMLAELFVLVDDDAAEPLPVHDAERLSRRQIDAAGDTLRRHRIGEPVDARRLSEALDTLDRFRSRWEERSNALRTLALELHAASLRVCGHEAEVTHRLKREDRIIDKLVRLPSLPLARIQDIGGCRAVVPTLAASRALRSAIKAQWGSFIRREYDYVANPKPDGYRAFHLVMERGAIPIEIQIRTHLQQAWARAVEHLEYRAQATIRGGEGDAALQLALRVLSDALAAEERPGPRHGTQVSDQVSDTPAVSASEVCGALSLIERAC